MLLYKYRSPIGPNKDDNTRRIFESSSLYYAKPSTFNDPFDAQISFEIKSSKEQAVDRHWRTIRERQRARGVFIDPVLASYQRARENIENTFDKVAAGTHIDHDRYYKDMMDTRGVLALSEKRDNLLLWAHYASNHTGLCIGFEWDKTDLPAAQEVIYQTSYKKLEYYSHTEDEMVDIALLQKSSDWAYEREHRSVSLPSWDYETMFNSNDNYDAELAKLDNQDPEDFFVEHLRQKNTFSYRKVKDGGAGPKPFNKSSLREVIFGARMSRDDLHIHMDIIEGCGFTPDFYRARKNPDRYQLNLFKRPDKKI